MVLVRIQYCSTQVNGVSISDQCETDSTGIPFTMSYDAAVSHLFNFDNTTTNGSIVIGGSILSMSGFDTTLAFYNYAVPKATSCVLTSQKIVELSDNN